MSCYNHTEEVAVASCIDIAEKGCAKNVRQNMPFQFVVIAT